MRQHCIRFLADLILSEKSGIFDDSHNDVQMVLHILLVPTPNLFINTRIFR